MSTDKDLCRLLFETAGNAILVLQNHQIVECNASAADQFGCTPQQLLGQNPLALSPSTQPNSRPSEEVWQEKVNAALSGKEQSFEWLYWRLDDETFHAQVVLNAAEFEGKKYVQVTIFDITPYKQTEAELATRLQELSTLQRLMTREGWQTISPAQETVWGYMFDQTDVRPIASEDFGNGDKTPDPLPEPASGDGHSFTKPVTVHGEIIGQLGVYDDLAQPLTPEDREFLDLVAEQVAEALERARLLEQTQQRARELEAVAKVSTAASTALEVEKLLQQVVDLTKSSFNLYHAHIYLLNETNDTLTLIAGAGDVGKQMVAQGWNIPVEHKHSLVARAARTQLGIIANDVRTNPDFLPNELLPETRSELAVPLIAGMRILGVLDVQSNIVGRFTEEDLQIQLTLAAQVAVALRNANLYRQVQEALTETEVLYDISAQINTATNLEEALQAAAAPAIATAANSAQLLTFALDEADQPEWAEVAATWQRDGEPSMPVGARFYLPNFPLAKLWISDPSNPLLIGDVTKDERLDETTRRTFLESNNLAAIMLPLTLAGRWVGLITINWSAPHSFTDTDQRLYKSLATQSAVAVNNLMLLNETRRRAIQLEKLTQTELALSQANNEEELVNAVSQIFGSHQPKHITLQYVIEADQEGQPTVLQTVASWRNGAIWSDDPALGVPVPSAKVPGLELWLNAPDTVFFIEDVLSDSRLDDNSWQNISRLGAKAAVILPLHSGGRWQGVIMFNWQEPYHFDNDEQFLLEQLLESLPAYIASRRAYLTQQEILEETASLYIASREINEAGNLQEIVTAIAQANVVSGINRVILKTFEYDASGTLIALQVVANWYSGYGEMPAPVGTSFLPQEVPFLNLLTNQEAIFFDDVQPDERLGPEAQAIMQQSKTRALAVLPLWVGSRQIGVLLLEAEEPHHFAEREKQPLIALARQSAVSIENQRLLAETSRALAEVEATQRRYTVQAWESYRVGNAAMGYEQVRDNTAPVDGKESTLVDPAAAQIQQAQEGDVSIALPAHKKEQTELPAGEQKQDKLMSKVDTEAIQSSLTVPLTIRGEVIGVLGLQDTDEREWTPEEQALVDAIAQQLAQAAENLRLIDETQQRAAREKRVNEIGEKIQSAQTLEEALQIAIKEVGQSLQAPETSIKLEVK